MASNSPFCRDRQLFLLIGESLHDDKGLLVRTLTFSELQVKLVSTPH